MIRRTVVVPTLLALLTSCVGEVAPSPWRPGDGDEPPVVCGTPGEDPIAAPLTRLSRAEYERTLRAIFGDAPVDAIGAELAVIPEDDPEGEIAFARVDQRLSYQHIDGQYRIADALAQTISGDSAMRGAIAPCATDAVDGDCLRTFAQNLLRSAYRHEPSDEEIDRATDAAGDFSGFEQLHAVLFVTLMAPDFLYRFENRGETNDNDRVQDLTAYEIATRLSYHFWGEPPDDELMRAAADGELNDESGYAAQVDRLFDDPRTERTMLQFFDEWLHIERGELIDGPRLGVLADGMDTSGLAGEMQEEVRDLLRWHLANDGSWHDVLTSQQSFARTDRLAMIYGADVWDGESAPPTLPAAERSGLLTRAGMLYTSDGSTNPFRRGAFLRREVLCDHVSPPPNDLPPDALTPPPVLENQTTREAFTAKVENEPCSSCHAQFSPLGYAMESYDGLGRFRTEEWLVSTMGDDRGFAPIDASAVPRVELNDVTPTANAVELSQRIADSPKATQCLTAQYFRFTFRREEEGYDECVIDSLARRVEDGMTLRDALRAIAMEPAFRTRRVEE